MQVTVRAEAKMAEIYRLTCKESTAKVAALVAFGLAVDFAEARLRRFGEAATDTG